MRAVIDVGCAQWGDPAPGTDSIPYLAREFKPKLLVGLDPVAPQQCLLFDHTFVATFAVAAWTSFGQVGYVSAGTSSYVTDGHTQDAAVAIDLACLIRALGRGVVLKLDCEGAEYELLRHLIAQKADRYLRLALVEWHEPDRGRADITDSLHCEVEEWQL